MAWALLVAAGLFEVVWALALKASQGFTRLWSRALTLDAMTASFLFRRSR